MSTNPKVTIKSPVQTREGQNGKKNSYYQTASVDCDQFRVEQDVYVDGPNMGYPVGSAHEWDIVADLRIGQYQRIELARRMTLKPISPNK